MTTSGANADERATGRAELRTPFTASEHATKHLLQALSAHLPLIGKGQYSSLHACFCVSIIPESRCTIWRKEPMDKFEEIGRRLDEELGRLRKYLEEEVAPETEKRTAQFLREVSEKLSEAAKKLESRVNARNTQTSQAPKP
jgi:hypothetical protein